MRQRTKRIKISGWRSFIRAVISGPRKSTKQKVVKRGIGCLRRENRWFLRVIFLVPIVTILVPPPF